MGSTFLVFEIQVLLMFKHDFNNFQNQSHRLKFINSIINWSVPEEFSDAIKGDICENFKPISENKIVSLFWLAKQTISIIWHFSPSTQRGSMMFIFSFFILTSIIAMTFILSGSATLFFNFPSIIIVLVPALVAPFVTLKKQIVLGAFKALVDSRVSIKNVNEYKKVYEIIDKVAMLMGWFGAVSGAVAIATNVEPESFANVFGPAFAVMVLTLLYAMMIKVFCYFAILRLNSFQTVFDQA